MPMRFSEKYRVLKDHPAFGSSTGTGGVFTVPLPNGVIANIIATNGKGWEHVSVHCLDAGEEVTPAWEEMCAIKNLFWEDEDCVIQYHPPMSNYVNNHKHCLHLWRPIGKEIPQPDPNLVGIKSKQTLE